MQSTGGGVGSGVSGDFIAPMVMALRGVGFFIVHAVTEKQATRTSNAMQRELDWELAAWEVVRNTVGMHLERVRM
jgi:hypothetical protein